MSQCKSTFGAVGNNRPVVGDFIGDKVQGEVDLEFVTSFNGNRFFLMVTVGEESSTSISNLEAMRSFLVPFMASFSHASGVPGVTSDPNVLINGRRQGQGMLGAFSSTPISVIAWILSLSVVIELEEVSALPV